MKNYIVKETEKAVCVEAKFENTVLENEKNIKIWIPKSCIEKINEKVVINLLLSNNFDSGLFVNLPIKIILFIFISPLSLQPTFYFLIYKKYFL